jgi:phospholipase C
MSAVSVPRQRVRKLGSGGHIGYLIRPCSPADIDGQINNSAVGEQMAMDYQPGQGYQMDHYTVFPQDGMSSITEFGPQFDPNEQYLASAYELADHNFQPVIAPAQPNVLTALNGTDHGWVYNNLLPGATQPWNSIFDEPVPHGRSWKIYYALPPSALARRGLKH